MHQQQANQPRHPHPIHISPHRNPAVFAVNVNISPDGATRPFRDHIPHNQQRCTNMLQRMPEVLNPQYVYIPQLGLVPVRSAVLQTVPPGTAEAVNTVPAQSLRRDPNSNSRPAQQSRRACSVAKIVPPFKGIASFKVFWKVWDEGTGNHTRPLKYYLETENRPDGFTSVRQRFSEWKKIAEKIEEHAKSQQCSIPQMIQTLERKRGSKSLHAFCRTVCRGQAGNWLE